MSINCRLQRQRSVHVVSDARYADRIVQALVSTRTERVSSRNGAVVRADCHVMVDVGSRVDGTLYPTPGQRSGEAHRQTSGRRVVTGNAEGVSDPKLLLTCNGKNINHFLAKTLKNIA